jgi:drug/metabolite transporter (DMT)-like permease
MAGMAVTLSGIALVVLGKEKGSNRVVIRHPLKGLTYAFLGAFGQGLGMIFSKLGVKDLNPFVATEVRILTGIICFAGIITFTRNWSNFNSALIGSLFGPVVGVSLSLLAVKHTSTGVASTLMGVVPVLILPVSILFFKEKVAFKEVLGAIIGVAGVGIMFLR